MQTGWKSGLEFLDPRSLTWEQRYALRRHAIELAHEERTRVMAGLMRRLWSWASRAARPGTAPQRPVGTGIADASPCRS
jgi:hypothetical protein